MNEEEVGGDLLDSLRDSGSRVWANHEHRITCGGAGHDETRAARVAAIARDKGMDDVAIATAMGLPVEAIQAWLGPNAPAGCPA
ncbi:Uncharacterised protein [Mycobacteroides abscessus]|uniref:Uncharacterized protein n=1 Tax=Mycobacteroides abscessus TaxID=36809 RepID=A0A0U0ZRH8_9MYCO|nr:Uncharacterised protein [Mycobacteroides abscessus]